MDYDQLETFVILCETLNISHTAERVYKTQPAVSNRIKQLEQELGFELVRRTPGKKSVEITYKGRQFLKQAQKFMLCQQELLQETKEISNMLKISSIDSLKVPFVTDICLRQIKHSNTRMILESHQSVSSYRMIANKEFDIAFVGYVFDNPHILCEPIFRQPYCIVQYHAQGGPIRKISASELDPEKEIHWNWNNDFNAWHRATFGSASYAFDVDSLDVIRSLLPHTDYWAILQLQNAKELAKSYPVQIYELDNPPPERITYMITNKYADKSNLKVLRQFQEEAREYSRENGWMC